MAYCRKCGAELTEGAQFCRKCGAIVEESGGSDGAAASKKTSAVNTARNTADKAKQVMEWLETTVDAPDAPGETVVSSWSNGKLIDPAVLAGMAGTAARAAGQRVVREGAEAVKSKAASEGRLSEPQAMRFCRYCGKSIPADSKFCRYCGK